jgi:hypothetical protein
MTKGETTEPEGDVAKDYDPAVDREASAIRRKPPLRGAHERPGQKHR